MTLPEFLEAERLKKRLNKASFARALEMHQTQLQRLLTLAPGKIPKSDILQKLATGLGCTEKELIALCYGNPTSSQQSELKSGSCYEVVDLSEELNTENPEQQKKLTTLKIAETLCKQDEERYNPIKSCAGDPKQWREIFERYPDSAAIFYFVRENDGKRSLEIAGDWSIVFLRPTDVKFNKDGTLAEDEITFASLPSMPLFKGECDVIVLNLSLANRYNKIEFISVLIDSFVERIRKTPNEIIIKNLYVNVYERDLAFYRELGFEQCNPNAKPSTDSEGKNIPILFKFEHHGPNDKFRFSNQKEEKTD